MIQRTEYLLAPKHEVKNRHYFVIANDSYQILHAYPAYKCSILSQNFKNPMKL